MNSVLVMRMWILMIPSDTDDCSVSKLANNLSRAKSTVSELVMCNDFQWFVTLTISPDKMDRYDIATYKKRLAQFVNNYNKRSGIDYPVKYVIVFESHKDGAVHAHGVLSGINPKDIRMNENGYLEWVPYVKRFGFMSFEPIRDKDRTASYMTKYISKDIGNCVVLHEHSFIASRGLKRAEIVAHGHFDIEGIKWAYEHPDGFCKIANFKDDSFLANLVLLD